MHKVIIISLAALLTVAATSVFAATQEFSFSFSGNITDPNSLYTTVDPTATATGTITFEYDTLANLYGLNHSILFTGNTDPNVSVTALTVSVHTAALDYALVMSDFSGINFDVSTIGSLNTSANFTTQATSVGDLANWGTYDSSLYNGRFDLVGATATTPQSVDYYTFATNPSVPAATVPLQITSFEVGAPSAVPEPSTYALLCISLGVVGVARKKIVKREG